MRFKMWGTSACLIVLTCLASARVGNTNVAAFAQGEVAQQDSSQTEFITAEELKANRQKRTSNNN